MLPRARLADAAAVAAGAALSFAFAPFDLWPLALLALAALFALWQGAAPRRAAALGFLFGALRGLILIVIPYMFYESFFPNEKEHFPWVQNAASLPYIKSTGNTIRSILVQYVPSSLTSPPQPAPQQGEQQGLLNVDGRLVTLAFNGERYYMTAL